MCDEPQTQGDILVVDDDLPSRQALSMMLADHGYEVRSAPDGPTALMIVEADPPDLILLDVLMFEMDGYEVCRRLKARPESCDIPILFVSALGEVVDRVKGFEVGGVDFVAKPFQAEEVLARVATHLALRRVQKQLEAQNAELRESEEKYRFLVENLQEGVWAIDSEARTTLVNQRMAEMLGYAEEEMLGKHLFEFMDQRGIEITEQNLERRRVGLNERHDFEFLRRDGTRIYTTLETSPIVDDQGNYQGALAGVMDITDRRRAEEALKSRVEELDVLNHIAQMVATLTDLPQALDAVVEIVTSQFAATLSAITIWSSGQNEILAWFSQDHGPEDMVGQFLPTATAPNIRDPLYRGQAISFPNIFAVQWPAGLENLFRTHNVHAMLVAPLRARGTAFGVLAVMTDEAGRTFSPDEISLAETIASDVAAAIDNARLYEQAQELAVTRERQRLARDLHDSVTQTLYSLTLTAEALPRVWEKHPDQAQEALNNLHRRARGALGEMRTLLFELRPAMLLEKAPNELLRQLAHAAMGRTQTAVEVNVQGERALPDEVRVALYRIAQEALNNVTKHAEASQVTIELDLEPEQVVLHVEDDGRGFDPLIVPQSGFGLRNMGDRAKDVGAEFHLESRPGQGTQIEVVWKPHNELADER
ncbi:MAG: PAS domain S-box protein [Anaerolineae bacterium]|jgi:PAS domain S-box-containing protein